jgi:hypothetical protein
VLFIAAYLIFLLNAVMTTWGKSRNRIANAVSGFLLGFAGFISAWFILIPDVSWINILNLPFIWEVIVFTVENNEISVGRFGSGGLPITGVVLGILYFIEFAVFMAPGVMAFGVVNVYCEKCDQPTETKTYYVPYSKEVRNLITDARGGYFNKALSAIPLEEHMNYGGGTTLFQIEDHQCKKCHTFRVLNIDEGVVKVEDDGKKEFKAKVSMVKNMIIEPAAELIDEVKH